MIHRPINPPRAIRRLAMQLLYQIDLAGGEADVQSLRADLEEAFDPPEVHQPAVDLALGAWSDRGQADQRIARLTPAWPTHRQPPVDRAILRLAHHEMVTGRVPVKVAINEAVELAKRYAGEDTPPFINGVLDNLAHQLEGDDLLPSRPKPGPEPDPDDWLREAREK